MEVMYLILFWVNQIKNNKKSNRNKMILIHKYNKIIKCSKKSILNSRKYNNLRRSKKKKIKK